MGTGANVERVEVHGFGDASNLAYGAVVYLRVISKDESISVSLLCSKTKVAPLKTQSIPRLELCAAVLLCNLIKFVVKTLDLGTVAIFCWSDSQTVLHWIHLPPSSLKCFVANRVSLILTSLEHACWKYVPGVSNPADCASRGMSLALLKDHDLWWNGPDWLLHSEEHWPRPRLSRPASADLELRGPSILVGTMEVPKEDLIGRFSKLGRLLRVTAYICRFIKGCRRKCVIPADLVVSLENWNKQSPIYLDMCRARIFIKISLHYLETKICPQRVHFFH